MNFKDKARSGAGDRAEEGGRERQRPSFEDGTDVTIEVHVIGEVVEDFYGEEMRVVLLGFIRPEMKFDGIQGLVSRIRRDIGIGSKMLDVDAHKAFAVDAFVNGRNASYSYKAFEINGKWTTSKKVLGWTLFRIVALRKNRETGEKQVELMAVCDKSKRLFVDKKALKKDPNWQPGWFDPRQNCPRSVTTFSFRLFPSVFEFPGNSPKKISKTGPRFEQDPHHLSSETQDARIVRADAQHEGTEVPAAAASTRQCPGALTGAHTAQSRAPCSIN